MGTRHNELRAILQRHEGTIHRRWLKKTNPQLSSTFLPRVRLNRPSTSLAGSSSTHPTATRPAPGFESAKTSRARVLSTPTVQRRRSSAMRGTSFDRPPSESSLRHSRRRAPHTTSGTARSLSRPPLSKSIRVVARASSPPPPTTVVAHLAALKMGPRRGLLSQDQRILLMNRTP